MAYDKELYAALKTANRRIQTLEASQNLIYEKTTQNMIDALRDKAAALTNVTEGNLRIGALDAADRDKFLNILDRFNKSNFSTVRGQKSIMKESKRKFEESFGSTVEEGNPIPIDDEVYEELTRVMESDEWSRFSEKYNTYSNVISDMVTNFKSYDKTVNFISEVVNEGKYMTRGGGINVRSFINAYRKL